MELRVPPEHLPEWFRRTIIEADLRTLAEALKRATLTPVSSPRLAMQRRTFVLREYRE